MTEVMAVIHMNEKPDAPDWSPVLKPWDEGGCCETCADTFEVPANIILGSE